MKARTLIRLLAASTVSAPVALLAGCHDWPAHDVARYRKLLDGAHPATMPAYDPTASLTLARALQVADANNEAIASSGENYIQALAEKERDAGNFLPTVSLAPTYNLTHGGTGGFLIGGLTGGTSSTGTTGTTGTTGSSSTGSIQLTGGTTGVSHAFSIPIGATATGSLSNVSTFQAAGQTAEQRAQQLLDERETILLQVVQSYYNVLTYEQQVRVYVGSVAFKSEKVRDQAARLKLGAVRPLDLAQSQSDLAATRVSLTQSRTDAANARSALARLMGVNVVGGPLSDTYDPPADVPAVDQWQRLAAQHRQDLVAAANGLESAKYKIEGAIREYFPSVSINFNYFLYNDPSSSQRWTGGLSGNIPIFSALAIEADVRSAWSQYRQASLTESQTRRQVRDDVNENYQDVRNAREKVDELQVEVTAAQKAVDLAERAYRLGSETNLDRLTQQDNLLTAQLNLASEQFSQKSSYLNLLRASGTLASVLGR